MMNLNDILKRRQYAVLSHAAEREHTYTNSDGLQILSAKHHTLKSKSDGRVT